MTADWKSFAGFKYCLATYFVCGSYPANMKAAECLQNDQHTDEYNHMKCPVCATSDLLMTERQGVEIDYCPQCRGVWLDRGELDKIIERTAPGAAPPVMPEQRYREPDHAKHGHGHDHHDSHHGYGHSYKKKSLLKELFDF